MGNMQKAMSAIEGNSKSPGTKRTVAGMGMKSLGGAGKGTTKANTGFKSPGVKKATVAPNQKLATKNYKASKTAIGTVQGIRDSIHKNRGGAAMKKILNNGGY
jgi:hypothetical protein